MTTPDPGWARLSSGLIHDPDWLARSAPARLVFLTSIALAKATNNDGRVSLRAMIGIQYGALDPLEVEAAAAELTESGLWLSTDTDDTDDSYIVRSYLKWNESRASREASREGRRIGAHRTNHLRGRHDTTPEPDCPDCDVSPGPDGQVAIATQERDAIATQERDASAHASARSEKRREEKTRRDETTTPPSPPHETEPDPAEPAVVAVADQLIEILGYLDEPSTAGERRYVARALDHGWTTTHLGDLAHEAASSGADDIRQYLVGCLRKRANSQPDGTDLAKRSEQDPMANIADDSAFPDPAEGWDDAETVADGLALARSRLPGGTTP